jgi:hypothetical protein
MRKGCVRDTQLARRRTAGNGSGVAGNYQLPRDRGTAARQISRLQYIK